MSVLDRWFRKPSAAPQAADGAEPASPEIAGEAPVRATTVADVIRVEETRTAEFYIGDLFRRRFRADPPDFPHHYVAFYRESLTRYRPVGYVHYWLHEDSYMCGGMVIDDRLYRRMATEHRMLVRAAGGIAELLLRETFGLLAHAPAIWGYVGDKQARAVDLRAGFIATDHPYLVVKWNRPMSDDEKASRMARVAALGPF